MRRGRRAFAAVAARRATATAAPEARAVQPDEVLSDRRLEDRARHISADLRCLVCQNQSIDDSDAPLAHTLRVLVRDRLRKGETDAEVRDFIVDRYGEYVLLKPVVAPHTWLLWFGPALLLGVGLVALIGRGRSQVRTEVESLSSSEKSRLDAILARDRN